MIVTYNWFKELVDFDFSPDNLADRLTMAGLEVDAMEKIGEGLDSIIVARLESVDPHPDADRLTLCIADSGKDKFQIVCGARNHKAGDLVALARVGTILPGGLKIKRSKIRGIESDGMLCSEKELGLAEDSEGIMILPPDLPLGKPVLEVLGLKDVRYELGLTPNRADCLSLVGVAREVGAMAGNPVRIPDGVPREEAPDAASLTSVTIEEPKMCPRYTARLIRDVKIGPSPDWLARRVESVGIRSINNVVDVTNLILMELGHPLHAFDFNLLRGGGIIVRRAGEGEAFTTLDGQDRILSAEDLVICDAEGPVALAGIMGGENSEIQPETTDILLESAYFDPLTIRRTAKRLGMHTESSHRFERGVDIQMAPIALDRAAAVIQQVAGGRVAEGIIDVYPFPVKEKKISLSARRTREVLGLELDVLEIRSLLKSIGLDAEILSDRPEKDTLFVTVPTFRHDLERDIDLIEEVARLHGYDRIPLTLPTGRLISHRAPFRHRNADRVRDLLSTTGFSEIINYSFVSPRLWDRILLPAADERRRNVGILNPLTDEQSVMRTTLVPSMLETVSRNMAFQSKDLRLFELRPVFFSSEGEDLPHEQLRLSVALCGRREPEGWNHEDAQVDFFDLKGAAESLLHLFRPEKLEWDSAISEPYLHPGKSCALRANGKLLGFLGEAHPKVLENFDIDLPVLLLDLDMDALFSSEGTTSVFRPISRFPDIYRDSAFLMNESVSAGEIFGLLERKKNRYIEDVVLFDLYRGKGIPEGKKSIGIRVRYRSAEKTLTDEEINKAHGKIVEELCKTFDAEVR